VRDRSDSELVAAARDGDRAAFGALLDRHEHAVRAVARRLLGDDAAEDVAQEAFLQAYLGLDRLRDPARFGAWLCAIAVNLAKMRLRARRPVPVGTRAGSATDDRLETAELADLVRSALAVLPEREREAVLLYYVDGLSSPQVASVLGERPGTIRVRLHRARRRLRERLRELAPTPTKEVNMIEVTLDDVVVRMSDEAQLADEKLRIVLLKEKGGERVLPIWIGAAEGDALALQLGGEAMPRPLTADLMARLLEAAGARVERVVVNSLREGTFYATVELESGKEIDSRPSDALNLAARVGAPILVDDTVMEHAFTGDRDAKLKEDEDRLGLQPERPGEWRSLSPELVKELHPPPGRK
jgi:RNA polymerase sigma factor (sigma-70 family)